MQYVYVRPNELTSPKFCKAFAIGCHGQVLEHYEGGNWAGFGSPDNWWDVQYAKRNNYNWYYGDHAYFKRHEYYRITKNDYQLMKDRQSDCKRFLSFNILVKPWISGKYIVICLQSYNFMHLNDIDRDIWLKDIKEEIKKHTDRPIKTREKRDKKPLENDLKDAYCVITYTSNAATQAILSGVPAICLGDCASSRMSVNKISDINNLKYPENRLEWAGSLADNQWTLEEIKSGLAWERLNEKI